MHINCGLHIFSRGFRLNNRSFVSSFFVCERRFKAFLKCAKTVCVRFLRLSVRGFFSRFSLFNGSNACFFIILTEKEYRSGVRSAY